MSNRIQELYELGQSIWCDNISRGMIDSGELQRLIDLGLVGVTSNPTILMKAVTGGTDYDELFNKLSGEGLETQAIYEGLVLPDIADAADILKPVYETTKGVDGYVSLEVSPKLAYDTEATIVEARRLSNALNRPNVLIKVPATDEGIPAVEALIGEGISVNVTLIFGIPMYERVARAYIKGVRRLAVSGGDPSTVTSVASFFVSRVDTMVDQLLDRNKANGQDVDHLFGKAAIANARLAYACFEAMFNPAGEFAELADNGARVQRPLWASTSTKNPAYPDTMYLDGLVGPKTVNTLPPATIEAALDHGHTAVTIDEGLDQARRVLIELANFDVDINAVTDKLRVDGVNLFARSFDELLTDLETKRSTVRTAS